MTGDPVRDFLKREAEHERWLKSRPACVFCGEPIQDDHYYDFGDGPMCYECTKDYVGDCRHYIEE